MLLESARRAWARDLAALIVDENRSWLEAIEQDRMADAALLYGAMTSTVQLASMWFSGVVNRATPEAIADAKLFLADPAAFNSRCISIDPCNTVDRRRALHDKYHEISDLLTGMERADEAVN